MTTTIIHSDVIGTSYQHSRFDATRLRATRKLIVKSTRSDIDNEKTSVSTTIIADLTATTSTDGNTILTPLGPRYVDEGDASTEDNEIVHPDNNFLPLQTVEVQKMGDQRYLVTAQYFIVPGTGGGSIGGTPQTLQLRSEMYAKRSYKFSAPYESNTTNYYLLRGQPGAGDDIEYEFNLGAGVTPESFARVTMVPQVKLQIPFVSVNNLVTADRLLKVGGLNDTNVTIDSITYSTYSLRFDGIQMDAYGGYETENGQTFKYKGFYEFTARADNFQTLAAVPGPQEDQWYLRKVFDGVSETGTWTSLNQLGVPGY